MYRIRKVTTWFKTIVNLNLICIPEKGAESLEVSRFGFLVAKPVRRRGRVDLIKGSGAERREAFRFIICTDLERYSLSNIRFCN